MSQAEANEVKELWAEQQREEAARHSLITVHDVAEATQLSTQDVERFLQDVRRRQRPAETPSPVRANFGSSGQSAISLKDAYLRLMPITGILSASLCAIIASSLSHSFTDNTKYIRFLAFSLMVYAFVVGVAWMVGLIGSALTKSRIKLFSRMPELRP